MVLFLDEKRCDDFLVPRVRGTKLWTDRGQDVLVADEVGVYQEAHTQ